MISPTVWVALGLGILVVLGFYFGREALKGALYGRVDRIRDQVVEVKKVLKEARDLYEESNARVVALESEVRHIVTQGEDDARVRCVAREKEFLERLHRREEQFAERLEAEKRQIVLRFQDKLWVEALEKVRSRMGEESKGGKRDKEVMADAMNRFSEVWARGLTS
jgi:F0F1-type ATP synthase membrane subunit b/b'